MGWYCGFPEEPSLFYLRRFTAMDIWRLPSARVMDIAPAPQRFRAGQYPECPAATGEYNLTELSLYCVEEPLRAAPMISGSSASELGDLFEGVPRHQRVCVPVHQLPVAVVTTEDQGDAQGPGLVGQAAHGGVLVLEYHQDRQVSRRVGLHQLDLSLARREEALHRCDALLGVVEAAADLAAVRRMSV